MYQGCAYAYKCLWLSKSVKKKRLWLHQVLKMVMIGKEEVVYSRLGNHLHLEFSWITPPWFGLYLTSLRSGCRGIQTAEKFLMGNLLLISPGCVPQLPEQIISVVVTLSEVTGSVLTLGSYTWLQWAPGATFSSGRKFTEKWVNVCEVGFTSFTHWE